ncbi:EpsG family protein [Providencia rettgeri]
MQNMQNMQNTNKIFIILYSTLYSYILATLPNYIFRDRANYLVYAEKSSEILQQYNGISIISNEPLFLLINTVLKSIFPLEIIPNVIVFFISFTISYIILVRSKNMLLGILGILCVLSIAQVFHLQLVILRQGLATALLLWIVYFFWNKKYFLFLVFVLAFIHSSMLLIVFFFLVDKITKKYISHKVEYRIIVLLFISFSTSILIIPIAELLSMRQAKEYNDISSSVGGGNFILYSLILMTLITQQKKIFLDDGIYTVTIIGISIYIGMYFISPLSGRLISTFTPFIICTLCYFNNLRSYLLLFIIISINSFIFYSTVINNSLTAEGILLLNNTFY